MEYLNAGIYKKCEDVKNGLGESYNADNFFCCWGGKECMAKVPTDARILEASVAICVVIGLYFFWGVGEAIRKMYNEATRLIEAYEKENKSSALVTFTNKFFAIIFFAMYLQIIYYKINDKVVLFCLQPCHLMLILQGIALWKNSPLGVLLSIFLMPTLMGTFFAIIFPGTDGLIQPFELESYWVQHAFIQVFPFYLICKNNFLVYRLIDNKAVLIGCWFLMFLHWPIFETIDALSLVNINFMLCPTTNMEIAFTNLPTWAMYPSYRAAMFVLMPTMSYFMAYFYKFVSFLFKLVLEKKEKSRKD